VEYAQKICDDQRVIDIIGGFHLMNPSHEQLQKTIEYLKKGRSHKGACLPLYGFGVENCDFKSFSLTGSRRRARIGVLKNYMNIAIRTFLDHDLDQIVELSLLAWKPVFDSFRQMLGPEIYPILYPDWRKSQKEGVESTCQDKEKYSVLVAELDGEIVGFLAYELNSKDEIGEIILLAVHPKYQNQGIGTELNFVALREMKAAGMKLAVVGTGGDESHAPARKSYRNAGYTPLPLVRYYQDLMD
jgi:GNAT superfamily N-acetyltransferase